MRLQLLGTFTSDEFQEVLTKVFEDLASHGADTVRNVNIYFQPCKHGRIIQAFNEGEELNHVIYSFGSQPKMYSISEGLSGVSTRKELKESPKIK